MIGYDHALESSSSSSDDDENDNDDQSSDLDQEEDEPFETNVFIKHLRKCFIAIDDNSYCESALLPDLRVFNRVTPETYLAKNPASSDFKSILSKRIDADSYEYVSVNRCKEPRSSRKHSTKLNKRLETIKFDLGLDASRHSFPFFKLDDEPKESIFEPKKEPNDQNGILNVVSAISLSLQNEQTENNDFLAFLKYEAHSPEMNQVQNFRIFLPMCDQENSKDPKCFMPISIYKSAKISDLIGLVCCKYIIEKRKPPLKYKSPNDYQLKIADDTGDIELEFSALESNNHVGKFGFTALALIDKDKREESDSNDSNSENLAMYGSNNLKNSVNVIVHFSDDTPDQTILFENDNVPMRQIYDDLVRIKLNLTNIFCPAISYRLEYVDEPGIFADLNENLSRYKKYEFYFFRENSVRRSSSIINSESSNSTYEKNDTKFIIENSEYNITYLSKWSKVPFKIELSKDNLELEEIKSTHLGLTTKKSSTFYSIPMRNVVSCIDLKEKLADFKSQIRIIVVEEDLDEENQTYKHLDFECDTKIAENIKSTLIHLIAYCNSPYVKQYELVKKQKIYASSKWSRRLYKMKLKSKKN